jgi:hypothetical protein
MIKQIKMEAFRIGFDLHIFWAITQNDGTPLALEDKDVRLFVTHPRGREKVDIDVQGNVIAWEFLGRSQRHLGTYKLTAEIFTSEGKRVIRKDICEAFTLVGNSCCENTEAGEADIREGGELMLASQLDIYRISPVIPQIGANGNWWVDGQDTGKPAKGEDAYQIAVDRGYDGTYEEYSKLCADIGRAVVSASVSEIIIMPESEYDETADYGNALIGLTED